jgi:predicted transposase/invertase (TIGR01784 family)
MTIAEQLIKEGMEKGRQEGIEKTAEAALRKGADINFVADITGLSMKRLQEIERKIKAEKG